MKPATERAFRAQLPAFLGTFDNLGTRETYELPIDRFLAVTHGDTSPASIARYLKSLASGAIAVRSAGTQAKHIAAVRSYLQWCMLVPKLLPLCPIEALGLKRPKVKRDPGKRQLKLAELKALVDTSRAMGEREHAVVLLFATTGIRASELGNAVFGDLDVDDNTGAHQLHVKTLKGGPPRDVEITPALWELLAKIRGSKTIRRSDRTPILGRAYSRVGIYKMLGRIAKRAGLTRIDDKLGALYFRHSNLTMIARKGASPYQIKRAAGHSRLETSLSYIDLGAGMADSPTRLLPDFLLGQGYVAPTAKP